MSNQAEKKMAHREKPPILTLQRKESRETHIQLEFELTKVLARLLSACANERTLSDLQRSLRVEESSLSRFAEFLSKNGFLARKQRLEEQSFKQTQKGARLLEAFVTMYRTASGGSLSQKNLAPDSYYAPCKNCAAHTLYPNVPPVTLFISGKCQLCHGDSLR
jgi:predicted transcriptional regulator